MPRPSKFTESTRKRVLAALATGNTRCAAAHYAGIGESTLLTWLKAGNDSRELVEDLLERQERIGGELQCDLPDEEREVLIESLAEVAKGLESCRPFVEFGDQVQYAETEAETRHVHNLMKCAEGGTLTGRKVTETRRIIRAKSASPVEEVKTITVETYQPRDAKASMFYLERRSEAFRRKDRTEVSGPGGAAIPIVYEIHPPGTGRSTEDEGPRSEDGVQSPEDGVGNFDPIVEPPTESLAEPTDPTAGDDEDDAPRPDSALGILAAVLSTAIAKTPPEHLATQTVTPPI